MGIIYLLLIVSLVIALFFLISFFWATKTGQYDDDYSPSVRILFDDETKIITPLNSIDTTENNIKSINTNQKQTENGSREV
jgi:cbb3-type cytochrome oxidase maturation protein